MIWSIFFFEIWRSENRIALSERKPPLLFLDLFLLSCQQNQKNVLRLYESPLWVRMIVSWHKQPNLQCQQLFRDG